MFVGIFAEVFEVFDQLGKHCCGIVWWGFFTVWHDDDEDVSIRVSESLVQLSQIVHVSWTKIRFCACVYVRACIRYP